MELRERIKERVEEFIQLNVEIKRLTERLARLEGQQSEARRLLYQGRSKEYSEEVLHVLADMMEEYQNESVYNDLVLSIQDWRAKYEYFVDDRLKRMTPEERAVFFDEKPE